MSLLRMVDPLENISVTDIDQAFMNEVLKPYFSHSRYLKQAWFQQSEDLDPQSLIMNGEFSIPESCYIDDTGHFNAVEYNICFNQICYVHMAHCIKHALIPELSDYDMNTFFEKQLPNVLIAKLASSYQSQLNAKHFYGTYGIKGIKKTSTCTFIKTYCSFHDDAKGKSKGEVTLAVMAP
ncbi:MAG: FcoT family thioesterase [Methylobacter sp.]|uniref:FcoT family thioesterase n=1 Tax=Methylobacter sp. TaxID=2051955 RepID=UPI00258F0EEE|nr:FcoT family thioesterase [Methylobacter sp.]MCL7419894.1 FcoT family thioesterase [Methylobacter sp.]